MSAPATIPIRPENPFEDADAVDDAIEARAAKALARFQAQWPADRRQRLGRMMDGDYSQVWAGALAPKEAGAPAADKDAWGLAVDLIDLARGQRSFVRQGVA